MRYIITNDVKLILLAHIARKITFTGSKELAKCVYLVQKKSPLSFLPPSIFLILAQILSSFDVTLMKLKHFKNTRPRCAEGKRERQAGRLPQQNREEKLDWFAAAALAETRTHLSRHFQFSSFISIWRARARILMGPGCTNINMLLLLILTGCQWVVKPVCRALSALSLMQLCALCYNHIMSTQHDCCRLSKVEMKHRITTQPQPIIVNGSSIHCAAASHLRVNFD